MADKKVAEQYFSPPPELGKWEGFRIFMWNSETGQFMGRTGSSWAKIIVFYLIFYSILVGFFAAILAVFYQTLDYKMPKWQMDSSLIGSNPGLGFRPMPPESTVDSTLIWYRANDKGSVNKWANEIDTFLEVYRPTDKGADNRVKCTDGSPAPLGKVCEVPVDEWDPCITSKHYNYGHSGPCIFLKLNKIFGWEPDLYNDTTALPSGMPQELKTYINTVKQTQLNTVWVSCEGENPADVENMGAIHYVPRRGFPSYYFPFTNVEGYVSPLVAVRFEKPRAGVLINIECKAWAKNIHHDRYERRGSVHFELMVD